ncbi:peptidase domain-containing ABC transporter [Ruminococcus albus]|uniref:peptidase domain-containing ABC transporter n=1 Tax=Ruminococcus albus TaxID=1264 RepID=UPI0004649CFA|nr:peptidase domain-containing ABC transporter [Ruminococcus albus]
MEEGFFLKYPHIKQHDETDCGAACLSMIAESYGKRLKLATCRELIKVDSQGASIYGIVEGAKQLGLEAEGLEGEWDELVDGIKNKEFALPFIARIINDQHYEHFVVVYKIDEKYVTIGDPGAAKITRITVEKFRDQWQEQIVSFEKGAEFVADDERKGSFKKFFRYITCQKKMLTFIFISSIIVTFINLFSSVMLPYVFSASSAPALASTIEEEHEHEHEHEHDEAAEKEQMDALGYQKYEKTITIVEKVQNKFDVVFKNLTTVSVIIIALYLLGIVVNILRGYLLAETSKRVNVPLTTTYYDHLLDLPMNFFETRKTGELMSRFSDTEKIREAISATALTVMLDSIMAIGCGIVLFFISKTLLLVVMVVIAIYALIVFLFKNPIKQVNHKYMESYAVVTSYLKESVDGIETIKAYQNEKSSKNKLSHLFGDFADFTVHGSLIYIIQEALVSATGSIGIVVLLFIGAKLCAENIISILDLFVFYYLIGYFINPVKNLINLQPELQTAVVAGERLNDVLDAKSEDDGATVNLENIENITAENLSFCYGNRDLVLKDIDLEIKKGQKIALVGESGSGKTTFIKLLMKYYAPSSGELKINGKPLTEYSIKSVRSKISYVSQNIFLFADTVLNNLTMYDSSIPEEKVREVCRLCSIDDIIEKMPLGYHSMLGENGSELSGGQKQRMALARAMLRDPEIIILDEATSHLDSITEGNIKEAFDKVCAGKTVILIAHRLKTIQECDMIYVMDNGEIIEKGNHSSLIEQNGVYARLFKNS